MKEKFKRELNDLFKVLPKSLKELNDELSDIRKRETDLISSIAKSDNYDEVKDLINNFNGYRGRVLNYNFNSFLGNIIYRFRHSSVVNEKKNIFNVTDELEKKINSFGEGHFSLKGVLNNYRIELIYRKREALFNCFMVVLYGLLITCLLSKPSILAMLLIMFAGGDIFVRLGKIRLSSIKGINQKQKMLENRIMELRVESARGVLKEKNSIDGLSDPENLAKGIESPLIVDPCNRTFASEHRPLARKLIRKIDDNNGDNK